MGELSNRALLCQGIYEILHIDIYLTIYKWGDK